jgi:hypothetical protein
VLEVEVLVVVVEAGVYPTEEHVAVQEEVVSIKMA